MYGHERIARRSQHVSPEQKCLLFKLVDEDKELKMAKFLSKNSKNKNVKKMLGHWDIIAEQLNSLQGPKKTAMEWRKKYWTYSRHRTGCQLNVVEKEINIHPKIQLSHCESSTEVLTPAPEVSNEKLNALAAVFNDFSTNSISKLRTTTINKLSLLLCANDRTEGLPPSYRMSITDWLLFDTLLVHENFDVIHMTKTTQADLPALRALFHLVEKYNIESLEGDQLAEAWATLTLEYNESDRQCTPMLLQRRWYQLKLSARERIYNFWSVYLESLTNMDLVQKHRPTPLQVAILIRYMKLALEPFMSWEDQIKNKLVILREQFESIAMNKSKKGQVPGSQIIETPIPIDLTSTEDEISLIKPGELETVTLQQVNPFLCMDESMSSEAQEHQTSQIDEISEEISTENDPEISIDTTLKEENDSNVSLDMMAMDTMTEQSNAITVIKSENRVVDNEIDIEMHIPFNEISVPDKPNPVEIPGPFIGTTSFDEQEPVLPKITNIFGNVHVPVEALSKISVLATQIANSSVENESHINASHKEQNTEINEGLPVEYENKILSDRIDEAKANDDGKQRKIMVDKKINEDLPTIDEKLIMMPVVNTVKLDDMGVLPMYLMRHINNKKLIEIINTKSKVTRNIGEKLKCRKDLISDKVELSSLHYNKSRKRSYSYSQLSKNPDFNITLKKLNRQFFKSDRNRMLLRACKPLCVDVDKSFEKKLVNGRMYIKPPESVIDYTNSEQAFISMTPKPVKDNISLTPVPGAIVSTNSLTNILYTEYLDKVITCSVSSTKSGQSQIVTTALNNLNYLESNTSSDSLGTNLNQNTYPPSQKIITLVPLKTTENNSMERKRLLDLYTLNKLLCMLANVEKAQGAQNNILAMADQTKIVDEDSNNIQVTSESVLDRSSTKTSPETKQKNRKRNNGRSAPCCWARAKLKSISIRRSVLPEHNCKFPSCQCCCKTLLAKYYVVNDRSKNNNSIAPTNVRNDKSKEKFNELDDVLADVAKNFSDQSLDKFLFLGNNKILLTTTKFPKKFKMFTGFQRYVNKTLALPKAIQLVLQPNGQVVLNRDVRGHVDTKILKEIIDLVDEFNQLSSTPNTRADKTTSQKKIPAQFEQEPIESTKKNPSVTSKIKSCLGMLFCKTLTQIKLVSELKYAYLQNGLFFKLDLDTGSLVPINVCITGNRTALRDCASVPNKQLSVPREPKTLIPIETQSRRLLTSNSPESVPSQSPRSIPSKSPGSIPSTLPTQITCKPIESTISELSISDSSSLCEVSNISYTSDAPLCLSPTLINKPLECCSSKIDDTSIISDNGNVETWNSIDKYPNIDNDTKESIKLQQVSSTNAAVAFEVDQFVKIL